MTQQIPSQEKLFPVGSGQAKRPNVRPEGPYPGGVCVYIDLPGQTASCVRSPGQKELYILLRQHRDVVFDVQINPGALYTVHAEKSDFYDNNTNLLVQHAKQEFAQFRDGERLHLWVPRNFKGSLLLKSNGLVLGRYNPNKMDSHDYGSHPADKPAPLIVTLRKPLVFKPQAAPRPSFGEGADRIMFTDDFLTKHRTISPKTMEEAEDESVHIVEISNTRPTSVDPATRSELRELFDFFAKGGDETALDATKVLTRNWILTQIMGSASYVVDEWPWIKKFFGQRFMVKRVGHKKGDKYYLVYKGSREMRAILVESSKRAAQSTVMSIARGMFKSEGVSHQAWGAAKGAYKLKSASGGFMIVFTIGIDIAEWWNDASETDPKTGKPKKDLFDLFFKIGVDLVKAGIAALITTTFMASLGIEIASYLALASLPPVALFVIGTIAVAIGVNYAIDWIDKKTGAIDALNQAMRDGYKVLGEATEQTIKILNKKAPQDYAGFTGQNIQQILADGQWGID